MINKKKISSLTNPLVPMTYKYDFMEKQEKNINTFWLKKVPFSLELW